MKNLRCASLRCALQRCGALSACMLGAACSAFWTSLKKALGLVSPCFSAYLMLTCFSAYLMLTCFSAYLMLTMLLSISHADMPVAHLRALLSSANLPFLKACCTESIDCSHLATRSASSFFSMTLEEKGKPKKQNHNHQRLHTHMHILFAPADLANMAAQWRSPPLPSASDPLLV